MNRRLVVFAKAPQPGRVKTRLGPAVCADNAADLARAFLLDVLAMGERLPNCELVLAYAPYGTGKEMAALAGGRWRVRLQRGKDLGERLAHAFATLLRDPLDRVVVIGSDSPQMPAERLGEAFAALDSADLAIGPCDDGGYYLIGLRRWVEGLFCGVRWSTDCAFVDTIANADRLGLSRAVLGTEYDVDDPRSLSRLVADLRALPEERAPCTRAAVLRQGERGRARRRQPNGR